MRVLWLLACLSLGLVSPAESTLRSISPMMGDGVQRTGPAGPQGDPGAVGPQGNPGPSGVAGPKGDAGNAGQKGDTGTPGAAGAAGPAGAAGGTGPQGPVGVAGPKGDAGAAGQPGAAGLKGETGATGAAGAPKRVERYTATSSASLTAPVATFTWAACTSAADVDIIPTWSGNQMIVGGVTAQTLSGATVAVKRSKGTLLLTDGPFEPAPSTPVTIRVICN